MSERQGSGGTALAMIIILGLVLFLGLGCFAAAGFLFYARAVPVGPTTPSGVNQPMAGPGFTVQSAGAVKTSDGGYNIFLVGKYTQGNKIDKLKITNVRLGDVPGECSVRLPQGPPYP